MAVPLPLGPLCPFKSAFWSDPALADYATELEGKSRGLTARMMDMQAGQMPSAEQLADMSKDFREANDIWLAQNARLRTAQDFQAREMYRLTEAVLQSQNITMEMVEAIMDWQPKQVQAMAERRIPPPLPSFMSPDVFQRWTKNSPSLLSLMSSMPVVNVQPFDLNSKAFTSTVVVEEFESLVRDHSQAIKMGEGYGSFDAVGKEMFLDQLALIEDRWAIFVARFKLMGDLNPKYLEETEAFLKRSSMSNAEFQGRLRDAHALLRTEAQAEGLRR